MALIGLMHPALRRRRHRDGRAARRRRLIGAIAVRGRGLGGTSFGVGRGRRHRPDRSHHQGRARPGPALHHAARSRADAVRRPEARRHGSNVLESRTLASKASLHLVAVGDRRLVVGLTPSGMVALAELDAAELEDARTAESPAGEPEAGAGRRPTDGRRPAGAASASARQAPARSRTLNALLAPIDSRHRPAGRVLQRKPRPMSRLTSRRLRLLFLLGLGRPRSSPGCSSTGSSDITVQVGDGQASSGNGQFALSLELLVAITVLSLVPAILMLATSFTRIVVVLSLLRSAIGIPNLPPNQVLMGLSLFLTLFVMSPSWPRPTTTRCSRT